MRKLGLLGLVIALATLSACYYSGRCVNGSGPLTAEVREIGSFTGVTNTGSFDVYVYYGDNFKVEVVAQENLIPIVATYVSGNTLIVETDNNACFKSSSPVEVHVTMPETEALSLTGSGRVFGDRMSSTEVEISNSGSGNIEVDSVWAESLVLSNGGSGYVGVEGSYAGDVEAIQSGSGEIYCGTLMGTGEVKIRHSSSGRVSAIVLDGGSMDVDMSGSGRIDLSGEVELADYSHNSSGRTDALDLFAYDVEATNTGSGNIYLWASEYLDATVTGSGDIVYAGNPALSIHISGSGKVRSY